MMKPIKSTINSINEEKNALENVQKIISLDLSYKPLNTFFESKDFTNKFSTGSKYIEFMDIVYSSIFSALSTTSIDDFFARKNQYFSRHSHIVKKDKVDRVIGLIKNAYKIYYDSIDDDHLENFVQQELLGSGIWQIGGQKGEGRIFGVFRNNVFKPLLFDPNHLVYKTSKGKQRRFIDPKVCTFSPKEVLNFEYPRECLRCKKTEIDKVKLIGYEKDLGLKKVVFICYDCYLNMVDSNHVSG